jgi:hypothetical protein
MASTQNQWDQKPSINKEDDDAVLHAMLLCTSQVIPMVLKAAIELNLFDIIASRANRDGYMSPSEISSQLPTKNPDGAPFLLDRMLRLLASYSLLTFSMSTCEDGRVERLYGLSPAGKFYVRNEHGAYLGSLALLNFYGEEADAWYVYICKLLNVQVLIISILLLTVLAFFVRFVIGTILRMLSLKKVFYLQRSMGPVSSNT